MAITRHAQTRPADIALEGTSKTLNYRELDGEVGTCSTFLETQHALTIGLFLDNSPAWVICDLAGIQAQIPVVPIPLFFSPAQIGHLLKDAGVDTILTDQPKTLQMLLQELGIAGRQQQCIIVGQTLVMFRLSIDIRPSVAEDIAKITYTSGTTGDPKGVCLNLESMEKVASSLVTASVAVPSDRHLCLLPLATLLENIGGIYVPLQAGATILLPELAEVGMTGAARLDIQRLATSLERFSASSCIMLPQVLKAYVCHVEALGNTTSNLRFIAVGGAPVSRQVLQRAAALGLPVYQGYGMSEAASVTTVNTPSVNRPGSVGKPLPHVQLKIADDGEILLRGSIFSGYLGQNSCTLGEEGFLPTGDIGHVDEAGFLYLSGRKKHMFITAFGRNVSPGWVESELTAADAVVQAFVYGEAQPYNIAILVAASGATMSRLQKAVDNANSQLPDYAQIHRWIQAETPFRLQNQQLTPTGRLRRKRIERDYQDLIAALYTEDAV